MCMLIGWGNQHRRSWRVPKVARSTHRPRSGSPPATQEVFQWGPPDQRVGRGDPGDGRHLNCSTTGDDLCDQTERVLAASAKGPGVKNSHLQWWAVSHSWEDQDDGDNQDPGGSLGDWVHPKHHEQDRGVGGLVQDGQHHLLADWDPFQGSLRLPRWHCCL